MTLANKLTIARIAMVPVFLFFLINVQTVWSAWISLVLFILVSLTDMADGYIARNYNQITTFGKFADPIADKILVTTAFIAFVQLGKISTWAVFIIVAREFIVTAFRIVAMGEGKVIAASMWGKVKTFMQMAVIVIFLIDGVTPLPSALLLVLIWLTVIMTIISGVDYIYKNRELLSFK